MPERFTARRDQNGILATCKLGEMGLEQGAREALRLRLEKRLRRGNRGLAAGIAAQAGLDLRKRLAERAPDRARRWITSAYGPAMQQPSLQSTGPPAS